MTRSTRPGALKSEVPVPIAGSADTEVAKGAEASTGGDDVGPVTHAESSLTARFGQINFINSLPLTLPLLSSRNFNKISFTLGTPAELNRLFFEDKLDLGAMSSFFYLENGNFTLIPHMSIASRGAVGSVLFFASKDPQDLKDDVLAITPDSATSVNLLKVLFAETYGFIPRFETVALPEPDAVHKGALVIGDRALHSDIGWPKDLVRRDLGQWWYEKFNLPMVFGVWAARTAWVRENESAFENVCQDLKKLFETGLGAQFEEVLKEAENRTGLSKARLEPYYRRELNFELTTSHLKGLELYKTLCLKHGLLT